MAFKKKLFGIAKLMVWMGVFGLNGLFKNKIYIFSDLPYARKESLTAIFFFVLTYFEKTKIPPLFKPDNFTQDIVLGSLRYA